MRPLTYTSDTQTGLRIGGAPPDETATQYRDEVTQYFGTFPVLTHPSNEFSIFHRIDSFGDDPIRNAIVNNNQILKPSDLIWCVVHSVSRRGATVQNAFEARGLVMGDETHDLVSNEDPYEPEMIPYTESKLGGNGFAERHQVGDAIVALEADGYQHLLQIGMHGCDLIDGFPWDPGYLNVWAKDPLAPKFYRFCIQQ